MKFAVTNFWQRDPSRLLTKLKFRIWQSSFPESIRSVQLSRVGLPSPIFAHIPKVSGDHSWKSDVAMSSPGDGPTWTHCCMRVCVCVWIVRVGEKRNLETKSKLSVTSDNAIIIHYRFTLHFGISDCGRVYATDKWEHCTEGNTQTTALYAT